MECALFYLVVIGSGSSLIECFGSNNESFCERVHHATRRQQHIRSVNITCQFKKRKKVTVEFFDDYVIKGHRI